MTLNSPNNPEITKLYEWIDSHKDELIEILRGVLRFPSVEAPPAGENAPFGQPVRDALDYTLQVCEKWGFTTHDDSGYAGHAEIGNGAEMVMAMGHLDVVPEGDGWRFPPYGATLDDGYIYARGSSDDKGPTYAALFGAKAILESGLPLTRRIRVLFGCNEESGFGCVHHYWEVANNERPVYAFTPDAGFPLIYAEKGIANLILTKKRPAQSGSLYIQSASGGRRPNMVPDYAEAHLAGEPAALVNAVMLLQRFWDKNVAFETTETGLTLRATGKSAHGSHPTAGDNAVARLARALAVLPLPDTEVWLDWVAETVDPTGAALGIAHSDEVAGPTTCNLGMMHTTEDAVHLTYNVRYPVTWKGEDLLAANAPTLEKNGWTLADHQDQASLYVPLDKEPVATLLRVYRQATGDETSQPGTMGGGTYARATPHAVAYGAGFPNGSDGPAHEPDERIAVETILNAAKIYAQALYELTKAP